MHDDQIRRLLRTLETDHQPDPAFADALYERVALAARVGRRSRAPFLLVAAALLVLLAASVAVGASLVRPPVVVVDGSPVPTTSIEATPSSTVSPVPTPAATAEPVLAFEAPEGVIPPGATVTSRVDLELRSQPVADAEVVGVAEAGEPMLTSAGPLLIDGARWYHLLVPGAGIGGHVELDPSDGTVELEPVTCPSGDVDLDAVAAMTPWARLACFGERQLTLEGYEMVGFGGFRTGTYVPEWLNGILGEFAISSGESAPVFVRVEPGTLDVTRPRPTDEVGTALLRVTGHFNHPASSECRSTGIAIGEPEGPTADIEPIAAEIACREQFVLTGFEVVDETGGAIGQIATTTADGIALRAEASGGARVVARVNAGQRLTITGGPVEVDGLDWYEVRIGPGDLGGWITSGPDGAWLMLVTDGAIAFHCDGCDGGSGLFRVEPDGSNAIRIGDDRLTDWSWSPDGSRLAATFLESETGPSSVVVMDPDGGNRRTLGEGYAPSWSPDGTRLAWSAGGEALVVTDAGLRPTRIEVATRGAGNPRWSPDGARIAYGSIDCPGCPADEPIFGDPPTATWTIRPDGSDPRQVTGGDYSGAPAWSPDGERLLVLLHDLSGAHPTRTYTLPATGGDRTFLQGGGLVVGASWSPDGTRMAFIGEDGLMVADGEGSNAVLLVPAGTGGISEASWSPSGRSILYRTGAASDGSGVALWVVGADGGDPTRITPEAASAQQGVWQPVLAPLP